MISIGVDVGRVAPVAANAPRLDTESAGLGPDLRLWSMNQSLRVGSGFARGLAGALDARERVLRVAGTVEVLGEQVHRGSQLVHFPRARLPTRRCVYGCVRVWVCACVRVACLPAALPPGRARRQQAVAKQNTPHVTVPHGCNCCVVRSTRR
jgi:hypothetical protein